MEPMNEALRVVAMLVRHEEAIGRLYALFARKFPEHAAFWRSLAREEMEHAEWIRVLYGELENGTVRIDSKRMPAQGIETSLEYVTLLGYHGRQEISEARAFAIALQIENSMIEQDFFKVWDGDDEELRKIFEQLVEDTTRHRERLRERQEAAGKTDRS
jgi:rubrerythrin